MAMIELEDVWKRFRVRRALVEAVCGVTLHIEKGEMFGFLGPNGAGKTTTLRILATLLSLDQGRACVAGYDLARQSERVRACIGYVGQSGSTGYVATGREHMMLQARVYGMSKSAAQQRMEELAEQLEMASFVDRPVRTYSGGQRRRLDLALGIVHRPQVLFLDEPSLGLDPQSRARLWEEVRKLHATGTTIFLTTHYLEEADILCDRLAIIDGGKIVAEGTPELLKQQIAGDVVTFSLASFTGTSSQARQLLRTQPFVRDIQGDEQQLQVYVEHGEKALVVLLQSLLLVIVALPLGVHINLAGFGLTLVLMLLLGICVSSCSYALALALKDENALSSLLNTFTLPVFLLSGITLPLTLAPPILRTLAELNPFAYAVNAARTLFTGDLASGAVSEGFLIIGVLAVIALIWVTRSFRKAAI